ncbi:hypothetical protein Lalb_Chr05g0219301 [Lupinus albus]|uniref:Uncharacterized protein n=1 Tax=Lupinus albus TaxID=3870 RepID=A0A6A4QK92_LUPAL|nr:hypothetical protein Lalb_Chr05g0219301 [Lupinus albus]
MANASQQKNLNHMQTEDDVEARGTHEPVLIRKIVIQVIALCKLKIMVNRAETSLRADQNDRSNARGPQQILPCKKQAGFGFLGNCW